MFSCKYRRITSIGDIYSIKNLDDDYQNYLSSSSIIGRNNDILIQILVCLPVKSLHVFKSVSKEWNSLISDHYFRNKFYLRKHFLPVPGMIVPKSQYIDLKPNEFEFINLDGRKVRVDDTNHVPFKTLTFLKILLGVDILQSCNGLFLCCWYGFEKCRGRSGSNKYYIFNPSTKQHKLIPLPSYAKTSYGSANIRLTFDPLKSPHYQVVSIGMIDKKKYQIEVYSSKTDSWRLSGDSFVEATDTFMAYCVFCNGCLHWVSLSTSSLLIFDIEREVRKTMFLPSIPEGCYRRNIEYFGQYKGHLHLIETYFPSAAWFDVLEMSSDYVEWNRKYRVYLDEFTIGNLGITFNGSNQSDARFLFSILLVIEEDNDDSARLVLQMSSNKAIISYDLKEKIFTKIRDYDGEDWHCSSSAPYHFLNAHQFVETLADV